MKAKAKKKAPVTNIVHFPESRIVNRKRATTPKKVVRDLVAAKMEMVEHIISSNMTALYSNFEADGIDVNSESFIKDFSFGAEIMKAALHRAVGLPHPVLQFIDANVNMKDKK